MYIYIAKSELVVSLNCCEEKRFGCNFTATTACECAFNSTENG